eukprot:SRR837773.16672.p2 GENE.SRR837773.16672~~SRR837773.16672.p2  ORF type:complete len:184 (+),score=36.11 SRR837773.16672:600-1151(+)
MRLQSPAAKWAAKAMKEELCYVAQQLKAELASSSDVERTFQLPTGAPSGAGTERFRCPEALFKPSVLGVESPGIQDLAFQALSKCDLDVQKGLASNVILAGGTMGFKGMRERMLRELTSLVPPSMLVKVSLPPAPRDTAFVGGSILASVGDVQRHWFTKAEYEDQGASGIHSRCLSLTDIGSR